MGALMHGSTYQHTECRKSACSAGVGPLSVLDTYANRCSPRSTGSTAQHPGFERVCEPNTRPTPDQHEVGDMSTFTVTPDRIINSTESKRLREHCKSTWALAKAQGAKLKGRDAVVLAVLLHTGLRASEVASLKQEDIFVGRGQQYLVVQKGKGGKRRTVIIGKELKTMLGEYLAWLPCSGWSHGPQEPLFASCQGGHLDRTAIWRIWRKVCNTHRAHDARHTFATELYRRTKDLRLVQKQLGHSSIQTTTVYADVVNEEMEQAMDGLYQEDS